MWRLSAAEEHCFAGTPSCRHRYIKSLGLWCWYELSAALMADSYFRLNLKKSVNGGSVDKKLTGWGTLDERTRRASRPVRIRTRGASFSTKIPVSRELPCLLPGAMLDVLWLFRNSVLEKFVFMFLCFSFPIPNWRSKHYVTLPI